MMAFDAFVSLSTAKRNRIVKLSRAVSRVSGIPVGTIAEMMAAPTLERESRAFQYANERRRESEREVFTR